MVVIEVLSPSTEATDRREKAPAYATLPSLQQYVFVNPHFRRFEVAEVAATGLRWRALGSGDLLVTPYGEIALDDLYDEVDRIAST